MKRNLFVSNHFIQGVIFHPGDKIDVLRTPSTPKRVVGIAPVIDHNGSRSKIQLLGHFHICKLSLGDEGEFGEVPIVIQNQMKFDGSLGPAKPCPVKNAQAQINRGGIQTDQFVLKPKLPPLSTLHPTAFEQFEKNLLIQFPWPMFIGIGQGGTIGAVIPKCLNFPSQLRRPPVISRREWARPNWQYNMATN